MTSRPTAVKLVVKLMMKCRPQPDFPPSKFMSLFIFDQRYVKKGASRGKHRAAERVDASGDLVDLISMVIVNSVKVPIPASLGGGISTAHANLLQSTGPYTLPFTNLLIKAEPSRVRAITYRFMRETGAWLTAVHGPARRDVVGNAVGRAVRGRWR